MAEERVRDRAAAYDVPGLGHRQRPAEQVRRVVELAAGPADDAGDQHGPAQVVDQRRPGTRPASTSVTRSVTSRPSSRLPWVYQCQPATEATGSALARSPAAMPATRAARRLVTSSASQRTANVSSGVPIPASDAVATSAQYSRNRRSTAASSSAAASFSRPNRRRLSSRSKASRPSAPSTRRTRLLSSSDPTDATTSRSGSATTCSAAASDQAAGNTATRRNTRRSGSPSRSWLHAIAARRLRCRPAGASWASSSRCRLCRRTASSPGSNCVNRAAATSSASGSPSSWRQIVTRWCRLAASRAKPGRTAAVRSSSTAIAGTAATRARSAGSGSAGRPWAGIASGGTAYSRSLATRTRSCEVASTLTRRAPVSTAVSAAPEAGHRLTAVDDEQHGPVAQLPDQPVEGARAGPAAGPEPGREQGDRRLRRAGAEQVDGDHAVREPVRDLPRQRGGEACLAHTRRPGQRQQPAPGRQQGRAECRELVGTPQECGVDHAPS